MTRRIGILLILLVASSVMWASDNDDFGVWTKVGVQKVLPRNFFVGLEGEFRTCDNSKKVNRVGVGANVNYKLNKYVKFGVAYNFLDKYKSEKTKYDVDEETGDFVSRRYTASYWRPKHRLSVDVTPSVKLWRVLRLSLREKYQYTHQKELTVASYEDMWDLGEDGWADDWEDDAKVKKRKNTHILCSRLKLEIDKKGLSWSPFLSVETQNKFRHMDLRSVRAAAGTEYKINARNSISAAYVFTYDHEDKDRTHAISVGYDFKF